MSRSEKILDYAPYCVRMHRHPHENALLEVIDDRWDVETQRQMVELRVVKTGLLIERSFHWITEHCRKLNEMETIAWMAT